MTSIYLPTQPFNYAIDYDRNEDDSLVLRVTRRSSP